MLKLEDYRNEIRLTPYPHDDAPLSLEERNRICDKLIKFFLSERGEIAAFHCSYEDKRKVIRGYMNERTPRPTPPEIIALQDRLFWAETLDRGIVEISALSFREHIALYDGDITRLKVDAIVNAANNTLLGCFIPHHRCVDNLIHSCAGLQLRADCAKITALEGGTEERGQAKITSAYNLPCNYVIHTVGPLTGPEVTEEQIAVLKSCYLSCLNLAMEMGLKSIAFCCISTGVFSFPGDVAAEIATGVVKNWQMRHSDYPLDIVFDVYTERDREIYEEILRFL